MIHVVHVLGELQPSGMERMLASAAHEWTGNNIDVSIISQGMETDYGKILMGMNYRVHYLPNVKTPVGVYKLFRYYRRNQPDAIHLHAESAHGLHALIARLALPKAVIVRTIHNVFHRTGLRKFFRGFNFSIARMCGVTHVSPSLDVQANELLSWGLRTSVIENWVDSAFTRLNRDIPASEISGPPRNVVMVGNCSWQKNHELILALIPEFEHIHLIHCGSEKDSSPEETALLNGLEVQNRILRLGSTPDVESILTQSHAFCMPSRTEGMPVALLEAICAGVPSWVADVPGLSWARDLPGVQVVPPGEWKAALEMISTDTYDVPAAQARRFQAEAQWRFSSERGASEYARLYLRNAYPR